MIKPMPQRPFAGTFSALWKRSLELIAPAAAELGVGGAFAGGGHGNRHAGGIPAGAGWIGRRIVGMHRCSLDSRCPELGFAADGTRCRATPNLHSKATICNKFQAILIRIGTISTSCIYTPLTVDIDPPTIRTTSRIGQKNEGNMVSGMRQAQERDRIGEVLSTVQLPLENVEFALDQYLLSHGQRLDTETRVLLAGVRDCVGRVVISARRLAISDASEPVALARGAEKKALLSA